MRLMAGVTGQSAGVIRGHNLGEGFRLGAIGLVTAGADNGCVELWRLNSCWIIGMFCLRSVASLAGNDDMPAELLLIDDICVTPFADFMAGVGDRAGGDLRQSVAAIMTILSETVRNDRGTQTDERRHSNHHNGGETNQVFDVLEQVRFPISPESLRNALTTKMQ